VADIQQLLKDKGPADTLRDNPYAEWYLNTSRIEGSPTWRHQRETYGPEATYDDFIPAFDQGTATADMNAIAATCRDAGAGYVVLTTKHHEGFCLWPTALPHPRKGRYHARRDIVGDLCTAVLEAGMRMGLDRKSLTFPATHPPLRHPHPGIRPIRHDPGQELGVHPRSGTFVRRQPQRAPRGHRDGHRVGPFLRRHRLEERQPADRHRTRRAWPLPRRTTDPAAGAGTVAASQR
jgi:Alpha-L-fucosidase